MLDLCTAILTDKRLGGRHLPAYAQLQSLLTAWELVLGHISNM